MFRSPSHLLEDLRGESLRAAHHDALASGLLDASLYLGGEGVDVPVHAAPIKIDNNNNGEYMNVNWVLLLLPRREGECPRARMCAAPSTDR